MKATPPAPEDITGDMLHDGFPALSPREREILHWILCGKTDATIASILGICPLTVSTHVKHILAKLGVENRACAILEVITVILCHRPPARRFGTR